MEQKGQELAPWLAGQSPTQSGEAFLSAVGPAVHGTRAPGSSLEPEQAEALGRCRYERQPTPQGYRHGYEAGTVQTAAGVFRLQLPQAARAPRTLSVPDGGPRWDGRVMCRRA